MDIWLLTFETVLMLLLLTALSATLLGKTRGRWLYWALRAQDDVIGLAGGVGDGGKDVIPLQEGVVAQNLVVRCSCAE